VKILFEDNHIIAVYKPANIPTQSDSSGDLSLLDMVRKYIKVTYNKPGNVFVGMIHRLDRPTQGVVVFAKTSKSASRLSEQIRNNDFKKTYYATVHGIINEKQATLTHFLLKNTQNNVVKAYDKPIKGAKKAILHYTVMSTHIKTQLSTVKIDLETGRSHQIRVQFAKIGHPIVGDKKYGTEEDRGDYLALVAHSVTFKHPISKEYITITYNNNE